MIRMFGLMCLVVLVGATLARTEETAPCPGNGQKPAEAPQVYVVQLTEFRMDQTAGTRLPTPEILESLEKAEQSGTIEVIETIRLSALQGHESTVQIGRTVLVSLGAAPAPGRPPVRQLQRERVGTLVKVTVEPVDEKVHVRLTYEASRLDDAAADDLPSETQSIQVQTVVTIDPATTFLAGGSTSKSSAFVALSVRALGGD